MARPPHAAIARHALVAMIVVMLMVLIGTIARALYVGIVHPGEKWVTETRSPWPWALA